MVSFGSVFAEVDTAALNFVQPGRGLPTVGYWPASLRSLTFFQSKSQALDVELRSCSLKERRSFSFAEFLLDVISNPPYGHNIKILCWSPLNISNTKITLSH